MNNIFLGDACAYFPPTGRNEKGRYIKIGIATKDDRGRIALKLDVFPLASLNWGGWINIFPRDKAPKKLETFPEPDDDIPF